MQSSSPAESMIPDYPAVTRSAVGANSLPLRYLIVTLVVAIWCVLGGLFHLTTPEYLLLGIPLLLLFQMGIHRQPLRTLWVRSGPPFRLDRWFICLWVLFSLFPAYGVVHEIQHLHFDRAAELGMAIVGAFGMAYALRTMRTKTWQQLGLCLLTVGIIGSSPQFLSLLLPHILHIYTAHKVTTAPALFPSLEITAEYLLIAPVGFVVEEVFFRGALDTYLHRGEAGIGWLSAVFISALWGLWHLPPQTIPPGHLFSAVVGVIIPEILVGVPLSLWWRKSGNLVVNNTAHAFIEGVRNGLISAGLF